MKRPALSILATALLLTTAILYYSRTNPLFRPRMTPTMDHSPLSQSLASAPGGEAPIVTGELMVVPADSQPLTLADGANLPVAAAPPGVIVVPAAAAPPALAGAMFSPGIQRKIIGRATLELVVEDTAGVVTQIKQLMDVVGGYVANANLYRTTVNDKEYLQGTLNLRVPTVQMDAALTKLERLGQEARAQNFSREDVTDQYTDLDAQLRNLKATEDELRALLSEVRKKPNARPDDILAVHRNVTEIRGQIEQLQGRKNMLDNLIDLATIDVTLTPHIVAQPVVTPTPVPEKGWQPLTVARAASLDLVRTFQGFANVGIWLVIYFLPVVVLVCMPVALLYLLWRAVLTRWQRRSLISGA